MIALSALCIYDNIKNRNFVLNDPYFRSSDFQRDVYSYSKNLSNFYMYYKDYSEKFSESKVTQEDVNGLKEFYENELKEGQKKVQVKYKKWIDAAELDSNAIEVSKLVDEKNKSLEALKRENTKTNEELKKEVSTRFDKDYEAVKKSVQERKDIKYYIEDVRNKAIYSNLEDKTSIDTYIQNKSLYSIRFPLEYIEKDKFMGANNIFKSNGWKGYIIIPRELDSSSYIFNNYQYYNSVRSRVIKEGIIGIVSLLIGMFILVGIKKDVNLSIPYEEKMKSLYLKLPMDLRALIFVVASFIILEYFINLSFFYKPLGIDHFIKISILSVYLAFLILNMKKVLKLIKNKEKLSKEWEESSINRLSRITKGSIVDINIKLKIVLITIFTIMLALFTIIVIVVMGHNLLLGAAISIGYIILVLHYIFKKANYLNEILKGTEEIVLGNLEYVIKEKDGGPLFKIAHNINNMKIGYKKSLESQIKSERLKTELITNVSHDLKTPLTSIINYISLLKKEDLSEEEIRGYLGVLDRKAERLKVLIEDLFETAKMSSGSVELNIEKVDVAALLKQAIAELDEKIKKSSLIFKFKCDKKNIYVNLDGKKTWRVFENLINNIIKYSQPKTRVYIDLKEEENKILIVMKNISSYEMDFDAEEIFERFKRGDKSRNTEGSGLGLAIANSIVQLQGGRLNIEIDGDLFKAIVQFNKI
ncbi:sensor histidine kinase [Clostridium thailandense]|uniref:sensor histidine kinase n=1 Tax=Clostridium thailandense TaxID=2794346 RepID=UPI003988E5EB